MRFVHNLKIMILKWPIYIGVLGLLFFVSISGLSEGGATRWTRIAGINFQPSEVAKVGFILVIASYLTDVKENCLITIYRIIKECCINSIKHSGGAKLSVSIAEEKDNLVICIFDNGKGFDLSKKSDKYHYGLKIMEDRVTLLKGKVKITSELGKGYETKIVIPFKAIR